MKKGSLHKSLRKSNF